MNPATPNRATFALPSWHRLLRRLAAVGLCLPLLGGLLLAQSSSTGSISGRVFNVVTGQSLQGAVVTVLGTEVADTTDADGRFLLSLVPAGPAAVAFDYVGLDPLTQSATVSAGATTTVNAGLKSTVVAMQAFQVTESAIGQSLAINQQKTAQGIINIISEETFGAMVDSNVGYALQRLPGLSVDDTADGSADNVNIRGVSGEFNSFQIDGNRVPNAGGTSRSTNTRQLVADGVTNIEVIKAPTPDRDGDAVGGIINVISRTAFQRSGREIKLNVAAVYNDLAGKWSFDNKGKWGYNTKMTYSDIYSVGGGEKNLGVSFTASDYYTNRFYLNIDTDWERITASLNPQMTLPTLTVPGGGLEPYMGFLEASHSEYNLRSTHTYGLNGSIDFRIDQHNSFFIRPLYSHFDITGSKYETDWDLDKRFQDAVGGRKTYGSVTYTSGRGTTGANGSRASIGYIGTDENSHNDMYAVSLGGKHDKNAATLNYDFYCSYSKNERDFAEYNMLLEPIAQGYYLMEYDASNRMYPKINILNGLSTKDLSYATVTQLILQPRTKDEVVYSGKADWEKKFVGAGSASALKLGAKYRVSKPKYDQTSTSYSIEAAQRAAYPFAKMLKDSDAVVYGLPRYYINNPQPARELLQSNPELFTLNAFNSFNASNVPDYKAEEATAAAYVMGTHKFGRHIIIGGVRYEGVDWSATKTEVGAKNNVLTATKVHREAKFACWLPGLHLRHELSKNLILRESFNRSYGRPNLGILSRGRSENVQGNIVDGNSDLKPLSSDNFDVQIEYYTAKGGLYSVGVFYKNMRDFTYNSIYRFNTLDANGIPIRDDSGLLQYTKPLNGQGAKNKGIELIARQRLYFLPGPLKGFSASVSATFTDSVASYPNRPGEKLPLEGFSDFLFTSALEYSWRGFHARADYRFREAYIEGLDVDFSRDDWFSAREQVDAEMSYEVRKGFRIVASAQNLTERPLVSFQGFKNFVEDLSQAGMKFTIGAEYKF